MMRQNNILIQEDENPDELTDKILESLVEFDSKNGNDTSISNVIEHLRGTEFVVGSVETGFKKMGKYYSVSCYSDMVNVCKRLGFKVTERNKGQFWVTL